MFGEWSWKVVITIMIYPQRSRYFFCAVLISLTSWCSAQDVNILEEGNFETAKDKTPVGFKWSGFAGDPSVTPNKFELVTEEGNQFVRLTVPPATGKQVANVELKEPIPLPLDWTALNISVQMRMRDYVQGSEPWHGGKLFVKFTGEANEPIGNEVPVVSLKNNAESWTKLGKEITIPSGAKNFSISVGMLGSGGILDVDNLSVVPIK